MRNLKSIFLTIALLTLAVITTRVSTAQQLPGKVAAARTGVSETHTKIAASENESAHETEAESEEAVLLGASKWVAIIFAVFVATIVTTCWVKMIGPGLASRRKRIEDDIAIARKDLQAAQVALQNQNQQLAGAEARIAAMLDKAKVDGENLAENIRTQAMREAEEAKDRAARDIESLKNAAVREVYQQTANISTNIAEQILRRNLNADDQRELVRQGLEQLQSVK